MASAAADVVMVDGITMVAASDPATNTDAAPLLDAAPTGSAEDDTNPNPAKKPRLRDNATMIGTDVGPANPDAGAGDGAVPEAPAARSELIKLVLLRQRQAKLCEAALAKITKHRDERRTLRREKAARRNHWTKELSARGDQLKRLKAELLELRKEAHERQDLTAINLDPAAYLLLQSLSQEMAKANALKKEALEQQAKVEFDPTNTGRKLVARTRELGAENEDLARQIKFGPYAQLKCETALLTKHNTALKNQNEELEEYIVQLDTEVVAMTQQIIDMKEGEGEEEENSMDGEGEAGLVGEAVATGEATAATDEPEVLAVTAVTAAVTAPAVANDVEGEEGLVGEAGATGEDTAATDEPEVAEVTAATEAATAPAVANDGEGEEGLVGEADATGVDTAATDEPEVAEVTVAATAPAVAYDQAGDDHNTGAANGGVV